MNRSPSRRLTLALALALVSAVDARAQSPSLDTLLLLPTNPTPAVDVLANLGGSVNISGLPIVRTESRRVDTDIRVDVLIDEFPVLAPPVIAPWSELESLGMLPVGTYNVTARLFWDYRVGPNSSFPTPWTFPDSFGQPLNPSSNGLLTTTFTVVPEPSGGGLGVGASFACWCAYRRRAGKR
jgi:hypothetical protein